MRMYLLDKKQRVRRWLKDNDFIEAEMTEEINAANQINFSMPLKDRIADNIYYVAIPTPHSKQKYLLFKLLSERVQNDRIEYQGIEEAYDELKQYGYIKDIRPNDRTAEEMLKMVLEPTRWTLGNVPETNHQSTNFYYITYLEALQKIVGLFNIELTFEVTIDPKSNKITRRQVNVYNQQGQRTGKRFEYGSNLLTIEQEQDSQELITALVGRGKGEQVSEGHDDTPDGYGRRITFADVVWSKKDGNPVDKPAGQEYLVDPEATELYGFSDGSPRIGLTVFEDIDDPTELIKATWKALQSLKRPKVSFKADVTDVGNLGLGDTVAIIRHDLKIEYFTRVYKVVHNLLDEQQNTIELGDDFSSKSITNSIIKVDGIANEAKEVAGHAATAANGKNKNYYSSVQPLAPIEGDIWYKDLGNGETDMYQYHNGGWVFIQSTRDLHVVENQVKEAQAGLNQAKSDIITNKQKADTDIENLNKSIEANKKVADQDIQNLNKSIEANKKVADESLKKLNDSVTNLQGQYDNNIVPNLNKAMADASDALQKYISAQNSIADLTKQAQQQGKDIADVSNTVKGLNINYANLAGDVNSTKVDVKGLQTTIGTANGDIAQLKLDAQNLQTMLAGKVDNTTYTNFVNLTNQALNARLTASDLNGYAKTADVQATANGLRVDLNSVTDRMNNLKIDITQLSARITANSQQFSSYYTKSETDSKADFAKNDAVNAIKSDGNWQGLNNILTNSGFLQTADGFLQKVQQTTIPMFNGGGINLATKTGNVSLSGGYGSYKNIGYISLDVINELRGKYMTISVDVEWNGWESGAGNRLGYELLINYDDGSIEYDGCWLTPTTANGKQRVTATYEIKDQHVQSLGKGNAYIQINCTSAKVSRLKIEQGSVATPWIPNPADLATQSAFSELSQSLEGLRSTVGSNYGSLQSQISQSSTAVRTELTDKINGVDSKTTSTANSLNSVIGRVGSLENLTNIQIINNAINANDYTNTGNYFIQSTDNTNVPAVNWCYLKVEKVNDGRILQTWQADRDPTLRFIRMKLDDSWIDWQRAASYSEYSELNRTVQGLQSTVSGNYGDLQSQISQSSSTVRTELIDKINGVDNKTTSTANSLNSVIGRVGSLETLTNIQVVNNAINANDYTNTGNYFIQSTDNTNVPGSNWCYLKVEKVNDGRILQTWQADRDPTLRFIRMKLDDSWIDWQRAASYSEYSELNRTVQGLQSTVSGDYGNLQSQINQTATTLRGEVTDKVNGLQGQITTQANNINLMLGTAGDLSNICRNPTFDNHDGWTDNVHVESNWPEIPTKNCGVLFTRDGYYGKEFTVVPGDKYYTSVFANNQNDVDFVLGLHFKMKDGSDQWLSGSRIGARECRQSLGSITVPDNAVTANVWASIQKFDNFGFTRFTNVIVKKNDTLAQINMSAGTTLIQNNKIYMDASSTIFSGNAFIPSAAITELNADKITTGTLNAANVNIINLNANNITTGTINGQNLKINLNTGEILFQHGKITSTLGTLNINVDTGIMSVTDVNGAGIYYSNGEMFLNDGPINSWFSNPTYGGIRRSPFGWQNGSTGIQMYSKNGVSLETSNYNGGFANGSIIDSTSTGAAVEVDSSGSATINGANVTSVVGGYQFDTGSMGFKNRAHIWVGSNTTGESGNRIVMDGDYVHIISAYRHTTGNAPNLFVANDGALVRSTSASKYKTNIKRSHSTDYGERLLNLPVATWIDKGQKERYEAGKRHIKPNKYFGMIAEDLADAGLDLLVSRNVDGEIEGIQYERIAPALIPVIKKLKDKVEKLEKIINEQ